MRQVLVLCVASMISSAALADASSFVEFAYIDGGENGSQNGGPQQDGFEFTGAYAFNEVWYLGGIAGRYEVDSNGPENDYFNIHGGAAIGMSESTDLITELGLWFGEQTLNSVKTKPSALELKAGVQTTVVDKLGLFATISLVRGDLDTPTNDDLSDFVWSIGGAYNFTPNFAVNLKVVEGSNGVNGQSDVLRIGARWTF